jgi:hypothetical protein
MAKKTGNKKSMVVKKTTSKSAPAKSTSAKKVAASTKSKQTGGAKTVAKKATPAKKPVTKKAASTKKAPAKTAAKAAATPAQEGGVTKTKVTRSFKVQLPGSEEYSGRFTGSTPYQAANKALSKYFRVTEKPKPVVTFSIRESTRGSKHNVYTYEGHRVKLETPVTYTIGEGNTITKHHKNQLKKVKKADLAENKKESL